MFPVLEYRNRPIVMYGYVYHNSNVRQYIFCQVRLCYVVVDTSSIYYKPLISFYKLYENLEYFFISV